MTGPRRWVVSAVCAAVLLVVLGGPQWAVPTAESTALSAGNVKRVKTDFFVANGTTRNGIAKCPPGTRVFGGGFASTGQHAKVFAAGPAWDDNGYIVYAVTPPVNITTGVGRELARVTIVAYCAPVGKALVLG